MTRFALVLLIAGLACIGGPAPALAQSADPIQNPTPTQSPIPEQSPAQAPSAPASENSRYSFHRIQDGFVRLDGRTGHVAQCGWSTAGWSCSAVPDERAALESEISRLQQENVALKNSLLSRGIDLPGGVKPGVKPDPPPIAKAPEGEPSLRMPSEAELDRALAFMKHVWRRLVEMMVDLQRDIQRKS